MLLRSAVRLVLTTVKMWKNGTDKKKLGKLGRRRRVQGIGEEAQGMGEGASRARKTIFPIGKIV